MLSVFLRILDKGFASNQMVTVITFTFKWAFCNQSLIVKLLNTDTMFNSPTNSQNTFQHQSPVYLYVDVQNQDYCFINWIQTWQILQEYKIVASVDTHLAGRDFKPWLATTLNKTCIPRYSCGSWSMILVMQTWRVLVSPIL